MPDDPWARLAVPGHPHRRPRRRTGSGGATPPAPTWWAYDSGCAWAAAWLTVRGGPFLGPRELLDLSNWSGNLFWFERYNHKTSRHRPYLVGKKEGAHFAIEVELVPKSKARLKAIREMHHAWAIARKPTRALHLR